MAKFSNKSIQLRSSPGTCSISVTGNTSTNVSIDNQVAFCGTIEFFATGGIWNQLIGCCGNGQVIASNSNVFINGKMAVLDTIKGKCRGKGFDPASKSMLECNCTINICFNISSVSKGSCLTYCEMNTDIPVVNSNNEANQSVNQNTNHSNHRSHDNDLISEDKTKEKPDRVQEKVNLFKNKIEEWSTLYPVLREDLIFNDNLKLLTVNSKIKYILIADNPGQEEKAQTKYLVGKAGKIARKFFLEQNLADDFDNEVVVLNKTPIHTKATEDLFSGHINPNLMNETQRFMADLAFSLHQIFHCDLWITGLSELNNLFRPFSEQLKANYINKPLKAKVYFFKHFSYNQFIIDYNKYSSNEDVQTRLQHIGNINKKNIMEELWEEK